MEKQERPIYEIAHEIAMDWKNPYYGAVPYLEAMMCIRSVTDMYGYDSAKSIINYFLGNAGSWRGETARRIKAELRKMVS